MELLDWAVELVDAAKRTARPDAPLNPGEWCKFCPAAPTCPAFRQKALDVATAEFAEDGALVLPDVSTLPLRAGLHPVGRSESRSEERRVGTESVGRSRARGTLRQK